MLCEEIQIVSSFGVVEDIGIDVPDVRYVLFIEVVVDVLADTNQAVLIAAGKP